MRPPRPRPPRPPGSPPAAAAASSSPPVAGPSTFGTLRARDDGHGHAPARRSPPAHRPRLGWAPCAAAWLGGAQPTRRRTTRATRRGDAGSPDARRRRALLARVGGGDRAADLPPDAPLHPQCSAFFSRASRRRGHLPAVDGLHRRDRAGDIAVGAGGRRRRLLVVGRPVSLPVDRVGGGRGVLGVGVRLRGRGVLGVGWTRRARLTRRALG